MIANLIAGLIGNGGVTVGDYESIQTVTVGAGGQASISFTSIPSTYTHLQIRGIGRSNYGGESTNLMYKINSDGTLANYTYHALRGDGTSASAIGGTTLNLLSNDSISASTAVANSFGTAIIDVLDYANTSKNKTMRSLAGRDNNGSGQMPFTSSAWLSTVAISSIELIPQNGSFVQYSSFALYGVK